MTPPIKPSWWDDFLTNGFAPADASRTTVRRPAPPQYPTLSSNDNPVPKDWADRIRKERRVAGLVSKLQAGQTVLENLPDIGPLAMGTAAQAGAAVREGLAGNPVGAGMYAAAAALPMVPAIKVGKGTLPKLEAAAVRAEDGRIFRAQSHPQAFVEGEDAGATFTGHVDDEGFIHPAKGYITRREAKEMGYFAKSEKDISPDYLTPRDATTDKLVAALKENGGFTYDPHGDVFVESGGFMVGGVPGQKGMVVDEITPEIMEKFKAQNAKLLNKEDHFIGGWRDPKTGKYHLDISERVSDRDRAMQLLKDRGEIAAWDLDNMQELRRPVTPGTLGKDGKYEMPMSEAAATRSDPIVAAAVRSPRSGKVYKGITHADAMEQLGEEEGKHIADAVAKSDSWHDLFVTKSGETIDRRALSKEWEGRRPIAEMMKLPGETPKVQVHDTPKESRIVAPTPSEVRGFGLGGYTPDQVPLEYYFGRGTDPAEMDLAYQMSRHAFDPRGPVRSIIERGRRYPGSPMWYDTRGIYRDAAEHLGEDEAARRVNALLGGHMPSSTARSAPPSNLRRAFMWENLARTGRITPEMLEQNAVVLAHPFGHFAQTTAHQPALARFLRTGKVDLIKNPKPGSFGADLTGNFESGTFDTVMSRGAAQLEPGMVGRSLVEKPIYSKKTGKLTGYDYTPRDWAYAPVERGLADAAHEARRIGLLDDIPEELSPVAPYQSIIWHGLTGSAEYGSMDDIYRQLMDDTANLWGVSGKEARRRVWKGGEVPLLPRGREPMQQLIPWEQWKKMKDEAKASLFDGD